MDKGFERASSNNIAEEINSMYVEWEVGSCSQVEKDIDCMAADLEGEEDMSINLKDEYWTDDGVESNNEECFEDEFVEGEQGNDVFHAIESGGVDCMQDIADLNLISVPTEELTKCHFPNIKISYEFYNWYARGKGFAPRKGKILRNSKCEPTY
ncbi:hypothetical protein JHK86_009696 [Glycine max]|nr:hypothetical protein JHK86_009696 [Glycine max]